MTRSLKFRLSLWLSVVVGLIALATGTYSYVKAFDEATEMQDDQLRQMAALIDYYDLPITNDDQARVKDVDPDFRVLVQELDGSGMPFNLNKKQRKRFLDLPATLPDGLQTRQINGKGWRLFVRDIRSGKRIVLAQKASTRDEVARVNALRTVSAFAVVIPALFILIVLVVQRTFRPVKRLSSEIDARAESNLDAVNDSQVPTELRPFIAAINGLLARMRNAMATQRRFVADAAHELRSPLTALVLQAERLEAADMSTTARERLGTLRGGLRHTAALLEQLLALARAQDAPSTRADALQPVSIQAVFRRIVEELLPQAEAKQIDLGVAGDVDASIVAQELDLVTLLRNLIDNAIRYTPAGGRVDLRAQTTPGGLRIDVEDSGPGIPQAEQQRVFDPFYRLLGTEQSGSGLGLSIVTTIAQRLGAQVSIANVMRDGAAVAGLRASVVFPVSPARPA
jgi:two-component system OmpR family sensor kinase